MSPSQADEATREGRPVAHPSVAVIIATYNRARYIGHALEGLLAQTRPVDELLVVDDGSTDNTRQCVANYPSPVRYLRKPNGGRSSALNLGLENVLADWIWFFDDDDFAFPDALARMLSALESDPSAMFAYSSHIYGREGPSGELIHERSVSLPPVTPEGLFHFALRHFPFCIPGMLIHRSCFREIGGFDLRFVRGQDYEFCLRLLRRFRGVPVCGPTFVWRVHDGPRGPSDQMLDRGDREKVFMEYCGLIGKELRNQLALDEYLPPASRMNSSDRGATRRALVHRMTVMASKGLVTEMLDDLRAAAEIGSLQPNGFGPEEARACFQAALSGYFLSKFSESPRGVLRALRIAGKSGGGDILAYLARGLIWYARYGQDLSIGFRSILAQGGIKLLASAGRWPVRTWT